MAALVSDLPVERHQIPRQVRNQRKNWMHFPYSLLSRSAIALPCVLPLEKGNCVGRRIPTPRATTQRVKRLKVLVGKFRSTTFYCREMTRNRTRKVVRGSPKLSCSRLYTTCGSSYNNAKKNLWDRVMHQVTQVIVTYDFEEISETAFLHVFKLTQMLI